MDPITNAQVDKYTDKQAAAAIKKEMVGKQFVLLGGLYSYVKDVLQSVGDEQRMRALKFINAQPDCNFNAQPDNNVNAQPDNNTVGNDHKDVNLDALLNSMIARDRRDASDNYSQAASTPPRTHHTTPGKRQDRPDDSRDGDEEQWPSLFSMYKEGRDQGGDGGGDDGDADTGVGRRRDDGQDSRSDTNEFTLVNSRNIEMKKFNGEHNCKMIYLEFNDSQR